MCIRDSIKYTAIASSLYHERSELVEHSVAEAREAKSIGWHTLVEEHRRAWQEIWDETDVVIEGDPEAQQGILSLIHISSIIAANPLASTHVTWSIPQVTGRVGSSRWQISCRKEATL